MCKTLLKAIFFLKSSDPPNATYPPPGKENKRKYFAEWIPVGWTWEDFTKEMNELFTIFNRKNSCTCEIERANSRDDALNKVQFSDDESDSQQSQAAEDPNFRMFPHWKQYALPCLLRFGFIPTAGRGAYCHLLLEIIDLWK